MATLVSLYSDAATASVPTDTLSPTAAVLGTTTGTQTTAGPTPKGKSQITLNWTIPTENELVTEFLGTATGSAQNLESRFDPITGTPIVREVTGVTAGGGSTTLSVAAAKDHDVITVTSATNFAVGDYIRVLEGATKQYYKISSINGSNLTLTSRINVSGGFTTAATVVEVDTTLKTVTTHYTFVASTGVFSLVSGQFTNTNDVYLEYTTTLADLSKFELYRVAGNLTVSASAGHSAVTRDAVIAATEVVVSTTILSTATSHTDTTLTDADNGEDWTYYLFAVDDETSPNNSFASVKFVETLPSIPQSLTTSVGDATVTLNWADVQGAGSDANTNGYNVFRDDGATFEAATAKKVNSALVATAGGSARSFVDGVANVTNRVSSGTVPFPSNGSPYSYKVESEDTTTTWTTGTINEFFGQAANTTASK